MRFANSFPTEIVLFCPVSFTKKFYIILSFAIIQISVMVNMYCSQSFVVITRLQKILFSILLGPGASLIWVRTFTTCEQDLSSHAANVIISFRVMSAAPAGSEIPYSLFIFCCTLSMLLQGLTEDKSTLNLKWMKQNVSSAASEVTPRILYIGHQTVVFLSWAPSAGFKFFFRF